MAEAQYQKGLEHAAKKETWREAKKIENFQHAKEEAEK